MRHFRCNSCGLIVTPRLQAVFLFEIPKGSLDPPMEGWMNLYDAGFGSSTWRQSCGVGILRVDWFRLIPENFDDALIWSQNIVTSRTDLGPQNVAFWKGNRTPFFQANLGWWNITLPETNSSHLKIHAWRMNFLVGWPIFRGYVMLVSRSV